MLHATFTWLVRSLKWLLNCISDLTGYCRAFVEVKPLLFVSSNTDMANVTDHNLSSKMLPNCWGFQKAHWHDSCIQKCVVRGKIFAVILSITNDVIAKICSESLGANEDHQNSIKKGHMERVARFCIYLLDEVVMENGFSWEDAMVSFLDCIFLIINFFSQIHHDYLIFWSFASNYILHNRYICVCLICITTILPFP